MRCCATHVSELRPSDSRTEMVMIFIRTLSARRICDASWQTRVGIVSRNRRGKDNTSCLGCRQADMIWEGNICTSFSYRISLFRRVE